MTKKYLEKEGVKLVDEYSALNLELNEKEKKLEKIRLALINFAKQKNIELVYGSDVKASVKSYPKLNFPKKGDPNCNDFIIAVKKLGLWDKLAVVDAHELEDMIIKGKIKKEKTKLLDKFIKKGETVIVSLKEK